MGFILPNFLVVGAAKSGTTVLHQYLMKHPQIYTPNIKEPCFFSSYGIQDSIFEKNIYPMKKEKLVYDFQSYLSLFSNVNRNTTAIGELSTHYLFLYKESINNISKIYGDNAKDLKIIIILRNPVEAAFANYNMWAMRGLEVDSFLQAIDDEEERYANGYYAISYIYKFSYSKQIEHYLEFFNDVKIFLFDDLKNDPLNLLKGLFEFLNVDSSFIPDNLGVKVNVSGKIRLKWLHNFLAEKNFLKSKLIPLVQYFGNQNTRDRIKYWIIKKNISQVKISQETKETLQKMFYEDILATQELIRRDLSDWLK